MAADELKISTGEHKNRIAKIQNTLRKNRIEALYLTNSTRILYSTGFAHISTERPLAAVIPNEEFLSKLRSLSKSGLIELLGGSYGQNMMRFFSHERDGVIGYRV